MINDKSLKFKLTLGYVILFATAIFSIWYIFKEIGKINSPQEELFRENNTIFEAGNTINNLYASESLGRIAMITASEKDVKKYKLKIDSVTLQLQNFKNYVQEPIIIEKLDTIHSLISKKEATFNEIISLKRKYLNSQNFNNAFKKFRTEKEKLDSKENITVEPVKYERKSLLKRVFNSTDEAEELEKQKKQLENRLKIEEIHQNKRDSLARKAEIIFNEAIQKESKLQNQFYLKEENLMFENKFITDEIKLLLSEVEQAIIRNSTDKIKFNKQIIDKTAINLAILGSISFFLVIVLGLIVIRDLNRNFEYKRKLETLNANMENLMRQKSLFFATVTHDIISPLNTLVGFTELLEKTVKNQNQKNYIKNIKHSTNYIKNLSADLVDFTKLEYNKLKIKTETFNFYNLIESIFEPLTDTANQKNIDLIYKIDESLNSNFISDPYRIKQILTNITTNAIKFTNKGSVTAEVIEEPNFIKISITDTGIGIEKQFHSEIFREFKQAHGDIEKIYGGTGLGLNITKRLIEILGGKIEFTSEIGKGTQFVIYIPKEKGEEQNSEIINLNFNNDRQLSRKNILVIDDDVLQLQLMKEIFKDKVNLISLLNDGENIDKVLKENEYHLIISDIQMPNFSGYKIINQIRKNKKYKEIPVIAFTGKLELEENEYLKLGFSALLKKPIQITKLLIEVHRLLEINLVQEILPKNLENNYSFKDFNLEEIMNFTQNDIAATKEILNIFIKTTQTHLSQLEEAAKSNDLKTIEDLAHKMLPMFKQLEVVNVVSKLLKLEREVSLIDSDSLEAYITILKTEIDKILIQIKNIEL